METDNKAPPIAGREAEWCFNQKYYDQEKLEVQFPREGKGTVQAIGFDSGEDTWQDFMALVELPDGTLLSIPVVASNMRMVQKRPACESGPTPKAAVLAKALPDLRGPDGTNSTRKLYRMTPHLEGHSHVVVCCSIHEFWGPVLYVFGSNENGDMLESTQLPGSGVMGTSPTTAFSLSGYSVKDSE